MISQDRAKEILTEQLNKIPLLRQQKYSSDDFKTWHYDTKIAIEQIFGKESNDVSDFERISYHSPFSGVTASRDRAVNRFSYNSTNQREFVSDNSSYLDGLDSAKAFLQSRIQKLDRFGISRDSVSIVDPIIEIKRICDRFHKVARQMRSRHSERPTLSVEDEYDVQYLFHSLLHLYFNDIRSEEWTPSYAGGSSRVDFLLKDINAVIEIKKTRPSMTRRDLADQLIIDIQRYQSHPDCKKLICFVYDPEGRVSNPKGIENDLNGDHNGISVTVLIRPE